VVYCIGETGRLITNGRFCRMRSLTMVCVGIKMPRNITANNERTIPTKLVRPWRRYSEAIDTAPMTPTTARRVRLRYQSLIIRRSTIERVTRGLRCGCIARC
jgi:hypothetical protein